MSMDDLDGFIWKDGKLIDWRGATTHVLTHSLHYGLAVFEGLRVYETVKGPAIFRLQDHTDRLFHSAHILNIKIPFSKEIINRAQIDVVRENKLNSCYIRPLAYYGSGKLGVAPPTNDVHVIIAAWPWGAYLGEDGMTKGIRIKTSSYTRNHVNITMCKAKASGNYMNSIMANAEATRDGYDEALLLDAEGYVAEGSGENFFIVYKNRLITPDLTCALEGITRETVIQLAHEIGLEVIEKRITRDEVYIADEAFFTGTAAEVTPIRELDGRQIGNGSRGPITEALQKHYFIVVKGEDAKHEHWLTYI